jgi:hypothetical protein
MLRAFSSEGKNELDSEWSENEQTSRSDLKEEIEGT